MGAKRFARFPLRHVEGMLDALTMKTRVSTQLLAQIMYADYYLGSNDALGT